MRNEPTPTTPQSPGDEPVVLTRRDLDALLARLARLEAERATAPATPSPGPPAGADPEPVRVGRRRALAGLAGAAAAGTVAALSPSAPAAADDDDPLLLGRFNTATESTHLHVVGEPTDVYSHGLAVIDGADEVDTADPAIYAHAKDRFSIAVRGVAVGRAMIGVLGESESGSGGWFSTDAPDQPGLFAVGPEIGLAAAGARGPITMTPETPSPLTFPSLSRTGTLYVQAVQGEEAFTDGTVWACVSDGTPGTWRKLAGQDTAGALHLFPAPRRVYDSRPGAVPGAVGPKTPLPAGNVARTVDLKAASSGVPAGATGALLTVLLVNATAGAGNVTVWANDQPKPTANTLVWGGTAGRFSTQATTAVDAQARVKVDASLQTHVVIDVVGYYR